MLRRQLSRLLLVVLPALLLAGCGQQGPQPFSVEVRVETQQGDPVGGASVAVRPCYESGGDEAVCGSDAVRARLPQASADAQKRSAIGEAESAPRSAAPRIDPIYPNPFGRRTTLRVETIASSTVQSTVLTLTGIQVRTAINDTASQGASLFRWRPEDLPDGLYRMRTHLRTGGAVVARDTAYAAIVRDPTKAALLGTTGENGRVSTTRRSRFPGLFDVPAFAVRDADGNRLGTMRVAATTQFVVTVADTLRTYRRSITNGKNTVTLPVSP